MKAHRAIVSRREFLLELGAAAAALPLCAAVPKVLAAAGTAPQPSPAHEALYFDSLDGKNVRCRLCPRGCVVPDGRRGHCRIRENRGGKYYALAYGRPCVSNLDPIEKKPFFHVYPGSKAFSIATVGCNFECKFCQNWDISQASPEDVSVPYRSPADISRMAGKSGAKVVAYTYNEPVVFYEYVADCARAAREAGLGSVMDSNGFICQEPLKALIPLLSAIKVDFKGFSDTFYRDICGGELQPVRDTLKTLAASGLWFEIVVLLIPTLNDSADEVKRMTEWIARECGPDVPVHFSRYHPDYKLANVPPTPLETVQRARDIALSQGCRFVYLGNVPGDEGQNTYCPSCKLLLVRRVGYYVAEMKIAGGKCSACGAKIPGLWG